MGAAFGAPFFSPDGGRKEDPPPMTHHECLLCDYVYDPQQGDPEQGVPPGTPFVELPNEWRCPICGATAEFFMARD